MNDLYIGLEGKSVSSGGHPYSSDIHDLSPIGHADVCMDPVVRVLPSISTFMQNVHRQDPTMTFQAFASALYARVIGIRGQLG
jgi:hypothetical protein